VLSVASTPREPTPPVMVVLVAEASGPPSIVLVTASTRGHDVCLNDTTPSIPLDAVCVCVCEDGAGFGIQIFARLEKLIESF